MAGDTQTGEGQLVMDDRRQAGYAMAVLLVAIAVMGVLISVAMPAWKQAVRREKEAELVFRGEQYVRAIRLFQERAGPGILPPTIEVLVEQHHLRKAFKDPMTGGDFLVLPGIVPGSGSQTQIQTATSALQRAREELEGRMKSAGAAGGRSGASGASPTGAIEQPRLGNVPGGISGVVSKSADGSLRTYNGRTHYNEWEFRYIATAAGQGPGGGVGGAGRGRGDGRGGIEGRGRGPGARGAGRASFGRGFGASDGFNDPAAPDSRFRLEPDGRGGTRPVQPTSPPSSAPGQGPPPPVFQPALPGRR